ncbi:C6 zinc finger domain protein [Lipomyces kononenkoae]|uniref:C6 zinc finger domain protein n=1 Tax=Lipomyces kononenkoae TaxID=34357 RepID=A0ACC3T346_LIPKO
MASSKGCLTCRARRKKCDKVKPKCVACDRNVLICVYPDDSHLGAEMSNFTARAYSEMSNLVKSQRTDSIHRSIPLLPLKRTESSPDGVTLSGVHYGEQKSTLHAVATYEHCAQALRSLKHGLTRFASGQTDLALELLITTLLFCLAESIRGDRDGNSFHHLRAARQLFPAVVRDTARSTSDPETALFVMELYAYILTVSSSSLAVDENYSLVRDSELVFAAIEAMNKPVTGMLFGCAYELFGLIPSAARVPGKGNLSDKLNATETDLLQGTSKRCELRSRVQSWVPGPVSGRDPVIAGKLYQFALLLLLEDYQVSFSSYNTEAESNNFVSNFIYLLRSLPVDSDVATTLCWPIAVAGSYAHEPEHRRFIRQYLLSMEARYQFGNIIQVLGLLDSLWDRSHDTCSHPGDLITAMKSKGIFVMLV